MKFFNFFKPASYLGIDIGTASIKVVQLSKVRDKFKLENYGEVKLFTEHMPMEFRQASSLRMRDEQVAMLVKKILEESKITTKKVAMSLPVFSGFSTIIDLPPMPKDELEKAIQFEARQYIPVPVSEVFLNSLVIGERDRQAQQPQSPAQQNQERKNGKDDNPRTQRAEQSPYDGKSRQKKHMEVLLVAIPNEIKNKYQHIAELAGLDLFALELETFALARALLKSVQPPTLIVDIGARSTDLCIVDNGFVRISHNFELAGVDITKAYGELTKTDFIEAEQSKKTVGLDLTPGQLSGAKSLIEVLDSIAIEIQRISNSYFNKTGKSIDNVILSGGASLMPGLLNRFREQVGMPSALGNPFEGLVYPPELKSVLEEIGPSFAVAVGLAMRK